MSRCSTQPGHLDRSCSIDQCCRRLYLRVSKAQDERVQELFRIFIDAWFPELRAEGMESEAENEHDPLVDPGAAEECTKHQYTALSATTAVAF